MNRVSCLRDGGLAFGTFTFAVSLGIPTSAPAQAWVPPAHVVSISFTFQQVDNTNHRVADGTFAPPNGKGRSLDIGLFLEGEYALTHRLSVSAGLPYVFAKYTDPNPHPPPFPPWDECRCWNGGWQDFGLTARYNLANGTFALTPSVSVGMPSHDYNFQGEAVVGRDLKEVRLVADLGQRLDAISPKVSVQGHYSYAIVERVLDLPNNRSNATAELAFLATRKLSARGLLMWQWTHGGFPVGQAPSNEAKQQHDRLLRDNYWHVGGAASYSLSRLDLFASYIEFVRGANTHDGRAFSAGISWPFELGSARRAPSGGQGPTLTNRRRLEALENVR